MLKKLWFKVVVAFLAFVAFIASVFANPLDDNCSWFVHGKAPATLQELVYVCHKDYAIAFDPKAEIPRYTVEKLIPAHFVKNVKRTNSFKEDPLVDLNTQAKVKDYLHMGYDRGHMTPDDDFVYDVTSESESFFMTNMVPQVPGNNRGKWKELEGYVRGLASHYGVVYVITGTVYDTHSQLMGKTHIVVPDKLWKVIFYYTDAGWKYESYIMTNEAHDEDLSTFQVPLEIIESLTGLDINVTERGDDEAKRKMVEIVKSLGH